MTCFFRSRLVVQPSSNSPQSPSRSDTRKTALRRSELAALDLSEVGVEPDAHGHEGLIITLDRAKTTGPRTAPRSGSPAPPATAPPPPHHELGRPRRQWGSGGQRRSGGFDGSVSGGVAGRIHHARLSRRGHSHPHLEPIEQPRHVSGAEDRCGSSGRRSSRFRGGRWPRRGSRWRGPAGDRSSRRWCRVARRARHTARPAAAAGRDEARPRPAGRVGDAR